MAKEFLMLLRIVLGVFLPFSLFFLSGASVSAGNITSGYTYAWSNNVGYIHFENVTVSDGVITGSAWSKNSGWIRLDPPNGGVLNSSGNLSGHAWGEQLGWIDFNGVSIDTGTGRFSGTAVGDLVGVLTFDCPSYCDVRTSWRPASNGDSGGGGSGGSGGDGSGDDGTNETSEDTGTEMDGDSSDDDPRGDSSERSGGDVGDETTLRVPESDQTTLEQGDDTSDGRMTLFGADTRKQEEPEAYEGRRESHNAPLTVEPQESGLLVWDFTTPEMAEVSKKEAVIIELPREIISEAVTISVALASPQLAVKRDQARLLGAVFDVTAINKQGEIVRQFNKPIKITLIIPDDLRDKSNLGVYSLTDESTDWTLVPDVVFDEAGATFYVDHLTHFAIFSTAEIPETIPVASDASFSFIWLYVFLIVVFVVIVAFRRNEKQKIVGMK